MASLQVVPLTDPQADWSVGHAGAGAAEVVENPTLELEEAVVRVGLLVTCA